MSKEIGGYLELEEFSGEHFHKNAIKLNCCRSALMLSIKLHDIKSIYIPDFMCDVIEQSCKFMKADVKTYKINEKMLPDYESFELGDTDWLFLADYYGQLTEEDVAKARNISNGKLIVDECQGFFKQPWNGADTIYSCRKYFGVPDGGYLYTNAPLPKNLDIEQDISLPSAKYVFGRYEYTASEFFEDAQANNARFDNQPIKSMSRLTNNLLKAVDYDSCRETRDENFAFLHKNLDVINKLELKIPYGAFMYPLLVEDTADIRQKLAAKKIYIPTLWPNVVESVNQSSNAYNFAKNILPLPVDQRYNLDDMDTVLKELLKCLN